MGAYWRQDLAAGGTLEFRLHPLLQTCLVECMFTGRLEVAATLLSLLRLYIV